MPQSYPGYVNLATTSHQLGPMYQVQPQANFNTGFRPPTTSQSYQPQQQLGYPGQLLPTTGQNYPYSTGYQIQTGQMSQRFPNQQQFCPVYQQPQMDQTAHQQGPINPNNLPLI